MQTGFRINWTKKPIPRHGCLSNQATKQAIFIWKINRRRESLTAFNLLKRDMETEDVSARNKLK